MGERIRQVRHEMGLTQAQLADKEFSRVLISLIERGECKPSLHTLGVIAKRLQKPIEFFLAEESLPTETATLVIRRAARALADGQVELALGHATTAVRLATQTGDGLVEAQAKRTLGLALQAAGRLEESVTTLEEALELCNRLQNRESSAGIYLALGNCALRQEELPLARRHYERALQLAQGKKRLQDVWAQSLIYLGTVRYRTGDQAGAIAAYQSVVDNTDPSAWPDEWGEAVLGLGALLLRSGHRPEATQILKQAETHFRSRRDGRLHQIRHNLALVEAAEGRWEHAYAIFQQSVEGFRSLGMHRHLASTLEEIGQYWLQKGSPQRARESLTEALGLLGKVDNGILRGRIYRVLGQVALLEGRQEQAESYLMISIELLRRLKAVDEQALSEEALRRMQ